MLARHGMDGDVEGSPLDFAGPWQMVLPPGTERETHRRALDKQRFRAAPAAAMLITLSVQVQP